MLKKKGCSLEEILNNVYGIDLNPLAVTISRANYLLALGRLIELRKGPVFIPVFMADSIKLPKSRKELQHGTDILAIDVSDKVQLDLPSEIALDDIKLKNMLTVLNDILIEYKAKKIGPIQAVKAFEKSYEASNKVMTILKRTLTTILKLIDKEKDSVWVFMMRNIYAPLRMQEKQFDLVVGNPPWISFKYIENTSYQDFVKETVFKYLLLTSKQTDLFTQMDTSTVFYCKTAKIYLKDGGILAFVMPRSVLTGAKQHEAFKKQKKPRMKILKILDVEKVNPLFNVDACSIIARKGELTVYPVESTKARGNLPEKNLRLSKAAKYIEFESASYSPAEKRKTFSPYYEKMLSGACIYPRTLWFVKFEPGAFGINPDSPFAESLVLPDAKDPWKKVNLKGEVESDFVFLTTTGKTLMPFKPSFLPVVLPLKKETLKLRILTSEGLREEGSLKMADWLDEAQKAWDNNATKTNLKNFPSVMSYVNYHNKLELQKQTLRYFVIQTSSGTNIAAAVIDMQKIPKLTVGKAQIEPAGFVADYKTFWFGTNNAEEAYYLAAILNSNVINSLIKEHQSKGKFGPRDICRLPFEQNIPLFDSKQDLHKELAVLGNQASKEAATLAKTSRTKIKAAISSMNEIDKRVLELIKE